MASFGQTKYVHHPLSCTQIMTYAAISQPPVCSLCRTVVVNPGHSRCEPCKAKGFALREAAVREASSTGRVLQPWDLNATPPAQNLVYKPHQNYKPSPALVPVAAPPPAITKPIATLPNLKRAAPIEDEIAVGDGGNVKKLKAILDSAAAKVGTETGKADHGLVPVSTP
jgi:hypothetical protein